MDKLVQRANASLLIGTSSWREQFSEALTVSAGGDNSDDPDGEEPNPSCMDYLMHFLTVFWKILFAFIPPTGRVLYSFTSKWKILLLKPVPSRYRRWLFVFRCVDLCDRCRDCCYRRHCLALWLYARHQGLGHCHCVCRPRHQYSRWVSKKLF